MATIQVGFQPLDLRNATENEYICLSKFKNILDREYHPDDPPVPLEEHIQGWKNIPKFIEHEVYIEWDLSNIEIIAYCEIAVYNTGDNEHLADFTIEVVPEYRNQGIGRQALKLLLPFAKAHQRTLLFSFTSDRIPISETLFEHLGARKGLGMHINQLKLSEFDKTLVPKWLAQSEKLFSEFEQVFSDGAHPDKLIEDIAILFQEVGNDQPRENLEMEDQKFTPELIRQNEHSLFARGNRRWTLYLVERVHGKIAGLTEVFWNPNRPMILNQGFTGIYPEYRNKGLGRWLKVEMMNKILNERPEAEFVRTGNANSNAPMLKINTEMGFKPYTANTIWQVETEKVESYLSASGV
jgi:RimJ/RimL family protein N-acetyltransferase